MRAARTVPALLAVALAASLLPAVAAAAAPAARHSVREAPGHLVPIVRRDVAPRRAQDGRSSLAAADGPTTAVVAAPPAGPVLSTWEVTYSGFDAAANPNGPAAQAAFQAAVDVWARIVASPVTIKVEAGFAALPPSVLGSAGASSNYAVDGQQYSASALADALYGQDVAPLVGGPDSDITAQLTSDPSAGFSFRTDGVVAPGQVDFMSVVLHELGHGLGFAGSMTVSAGSGSHAQPFPFAFDRWAYDAAAGGAPLTARAAPSTALADALQSQSVWWGGAHAVAANGGARPRLHAPAAWQPGSSFSHLDETTYGAGSPDSLMTPSIGAQEVIHSPGALAVAMLADEGWQAALPTGTTAGPPGAPTGVTATAGDASARVSWTAPTGVSSPVTGYVVTTSTGATTTTTGTAVTVTGLDNGTACSFSVRALSAAGDGPESAPSAAVVPAGPPSAVDGLVAVRTGDGVVALSWQPAVPRGSAVLGYAVTVLVSPSPSVLWKPGAGTTHTVTGLATGAPVSFSVAAVSAAGTGAASAPSTPVVPDATAPVLTRLSGPAAFTRATTATLSYAVVDHGSATQLLCRRDGAAPVSCPASWSGLGEGPHTVTAVAVDAAGNASAPLATTWVVDRTAPALSVTAVPPVTLATTAPLSWSASDSGSAGVTYRVRTRRSAWNGPAGAWGAVVTTAARSAAPALSRGWTACTSVAAVDRAGNSSPWSAERCTAAALDDRSLSAGAGWQRLGASWAYGSTTTRAVTAGRRLTLPNATGRRVALVAATCPTCGSVTVAWGASTRTLSLVSATTRARAVLVVDLGSVRTGTVTVTTRSNRQVVVDGLAVSRS